MVHLNHCASLAIHQRQPKKLAGIDHYNPHQKKFFMEGLERLWQASRERVPDQPIYFWCMPGNSFSIEMVQPASRPAHRESVSA